MNLRHSIFLAVVGLVSAFAAEPSLATDKRAVVELFTSQGCSSCPAADRLFGELSRDPSLITLSLAVDYWDYLGWKDTLALSAHTARERAYALARGDREVYTPQAVVNGAVAVLGSDKNAIERAIVQTKANAQPLSVPVTVKIDGDKVVAEIADAPGAARNAEVWLCPVTKKVTVNVGRGENGGNSLTYYNVVRGWKKLGDWNGKAARFSIPLSDATGADVDSFVVLVQNGAAAKPGVVVGAATVAAH